MPICNRWCQDLTRPEQYPDWVACQSPGPWDDNLLKRGSRQEEQVNDTEALFDVFDDSDEETDGAPEITGVPALFLRKLRDRTATWRSLGIDHSDVFTARAGDRIWVVFSLLDQDANLIMGSVRADVTDTEWKAAWVGAGDAHDFEDSSPVDPTGGPIDDPDRDTDTAISWLLEQLNSPISRYAWLRDGQVTAQLWRIDDTGQPLAAAGEPPEDASLGGADRVIRIR